MRHQVTLVGGQLLPIYLGIKEFAPDRVHFILSNESRDKLSFLEPYLNELQIFEYKCNAYDFNSIKSICERIVDRIGEEDEIHFNLTGGTKLMALAAHAVMHERNKIGFYINQDDTLLELPLNKKLNVQYDLSIDEFVGISGHKQFSSKVLQYYCAKDYLAVSKIEQFANIDNIKYTFITGHFRKKFTSSYQQIPVTGKETLTNGIQVVWSKNRIQGIQNAITLFDFESNNIVDLFFNAGWWELLVAIEIEKWKLAKEVLLKFELKFKTDKRFMKNEIDILVNLGKKLLFVECKSGKITQEDINKIRVIRETYGGLISKSLLVARFLPKNTIIEKCKELDIELFYCNNSQGVLINPLSNLSIVLNSLNEKLSA